MRSERHILKTSWFLFVLLLCFAVFYPSSAFAEDENTVNPNQMPDSSFIYDTSISDLSTADSYYNDQTVQIVGEVVGDRILDDPLSTYCWITLGSTDADSNTSVSVWMTQEDSEKIDIYGKHGSTGTKLQVRGTFHLTCSEHDGMTDIHAEQVNIASKGSIHADEFDIMTFVPGIIVVLVGFIMMFAYYKARERLR